ncbi:radical SAM protein [Bacteriovorax sp. DB6_IX]|uniref:radical SAM protein n=1 Tax=Bacteriovorax sp. DB6_IX TaxID=1353530 RepID=UPI000389DA3E|nr:radical SAM protein [Bacteriovorax sp. DB6_IX]EQC52546.1 radical SAM domain protein [Bacteriovorax sp. DB6_IX]
MNPFSKIERTPFGKNWIFLNWLMTNHCNYRCSYCAPSLQMGPRQSLDIKLIENFLTRLARDDKKLFVEFSGGEPTRIKEFPQILKMITQLGGKTLLISNGSAKLEWWKNNASFLNIVQLSYHSEFVNVEHFKNVVNILKEAGVHIHISFMMKPDTFEEILETAKSLKEEVSCSMHLQPLRADFAGMDREDFLYSPAQRKIMTHFKGRRALTLENISINLKRLMIGYKGVIPTPLNLQRLEMNGQNSFQGWKCWAGIESFVINGEGDIYRGWCLEGGRIGSIFEDFNPDEIEPIICKKKFCDCRFDIHSKKIKEL